MFINFTIKLNGGTYEVLTAPNTIRLVNDF